MNFWKKLARNRRGAALLEYSLLIAGVALVTAAAVSVLGHKVSDLTSAVATVIPGAHGDDNAPIVSGKLIETRDDIPGEDTTGATTGIGIDAEAIAAAAGNGRLGDNTGLNGGAAGDLADLVLEAG